MPLGFPVILVIVDARHFFLLLVLRMLRAYRDCFAAFDLADAATLLMDVPIQNSAMLIF